MKYNSYFIIAFFLFYTFQMNSQQYKFGLKGGVNYNTIGVLYHLGTSSGGGSNVIPYDDTYYDANKELGTQFGVFGMVQFESFFIRPELNIVTLKNNYPLSQKISYYNVSKIEIPILLGVKVVEPVFLYAGPIFNTISKTTLDGAETPILYEKSSTSVGAGLLLEFNRFGLDIRYQYNLAKTEQQRVDILRATYGTNVAHLLEYNGSQISISAHINIINIDSDNKRRSGKDTKWQGNCLN